MISASCIGHIYQSKEVTRAVQPYLEATLSLYKSLPITREDCPILREFLFMIKVMINHLYVVNRYYIETWSCGPIFNTNRHSLYISVDTTSSSKL